MFGEDNSATFVDEPPTAEQPLVAAAAAPSPEMEVAGAAVSPGAVSATLAYMAPSNDEALVTNTITSTSSAEASDAITVSVASVTTTDLVVASDVLTASVVQTSEVAEAAQAVVAATAPPPTAAPEAATPVETSALDSYNEPASTSPSPGVDRSILQWSQITTALLTLILAAFWWRSRSQRPNAR
jgi:hypothetical protein